MNHSLEPAKSGRAACRGCGERIAKGSLRFGERLPNPYDEGETEQTLWFHPVCGASKRPESFLQALDDHTQPLDDLARLRRLALQGLEHRRLPRLVRLEPAATGRARCRQCREPIPKGHWRIALDFFEDGRFSPAGFIHVQCAGAYFGTTDIGERLAASRVALSDDDLSQLLQGG